MAAEEINFADLDYRGLRRVYIENIQMRTIAECQNLLAAIRVLRLDRPMESDKSGERISLQTLDKTEQEAKEAIGIFQLCDRRPRVIVPPDDLH